MELRVLRYFLTVAQEKNINRAAQFLHVSQPTISRQLKALEAELGVQLFIRGNREITLTEAGQYLVDKAQQMLTLETQVETNIGQRDAAISGKVVVGCNETPSVKFLADATRKINQRYPLIQVEIVSTNADTIKKSLANGVFDFGIILSPTTNQDFDFLNLPGKQEWGVFMPREADLAKQPAVSRTDLIASKLILSRQPEFTDELNRWLGSSQEALHVTATYDLLYNALLFVTAGVGYAVGVGWPVDTLGAQLTFRPLTPALESSSRLIWLKGIRLSGAARVVLRALSQEVNADEQLNED